MIVKQIGYLKKEQVLEIKKHFCIYKTNKNTRVLVIEPDTIGSIHLYYPKKDRLPYKLTEGKKIVSGEKVFDSKSGATLTTDGWNNNNQIMAYEWYDFL